MARGTEPWPSKRVFVDQTRVCNYSEEVPELFFGELVLSTPAHGADATDLVGLWIVTNGKSPLDPLERRRVP